MQTSARMASRVLSLNKTMNRHIVNSFFEPKIFSFSQLNNKRNYSNKNWSKNNNNIFSFFQKKNRNNIIVSNQFYFKNNKSFPTKNNNKNYEFDEDEDDYKNERNLGNLQFYNEGGVTPEEQREIMKEALKKPSEETKKELPKTNNASVNNFKLNINNPEQNKKAIAAFYQAIDKNINNATFYENKGKICEFLKEYEEAIEYYNKSIAINPTNYSVYDKKAKTLVILKKFEEALKVLQKSIEIFPENYEAFYLRGIIFKKLGRYEEAIEEYKKSIEINENHAFVDAIGYCYFQLKEYEKALEAFEKAVQIKPDFYDAIINQVQTLRILGRFEESVNLFFSFDYRVFEGEESTVVQYAKTLKEEGKIEEASLWIDRFIGSSMWYYLDPFAV